MGWDVSVWRVVGVLGVDYNLYNRQHINISDEPNDQIMNECKWMSDKTANYYQSVSKIADNNEVTVRLNH